MGTQTKSPTNAVVATELGGSTGWTSVTNVRDNDEVFSYSNGVAFSLVTSQPIVANGFNFTIPTTATILGITVRTIKKSNVSNGNSYVYDNCVYLYNAPSLIGTNKTQGGAWSTNTTTSVYGGSADLWSASLTPAIVNSSYFGVAVGCDMFDIAGAVTRGYIDYIEMTVTYSDNSPPNAPTNLVPNSGAYRNKANAQNFTFTYSDPEANACSAYRFNYKKTTDSTYTSSAWIANTTANGGTITHTVAANTFALDTNYQWYVEVKDSEGAESVDSAMATFNTLTTPSVASTNPKDATKKNANTAFTVEWTFSDPNGGSQTAHEVVYQQISPTTGSEVSTGKVTSTDLYHLFEANALSAVGDPIYQWKVRAYDSDDIASPWSGWNTFTYVKPYATTGVFTSNVIETPRGMYVPATVSFVATVPTGSAINVELRTSEDNVTWTDWAVVTSNTLYSTLHAYFQYRATFTPTEELLSTPSLDSFTLTYPDQYYATGEWLSPILDCADIAAWSGNLALDKQEMGGSVVCETRHRWDSTCEWSNWGSPAFAETSAETQLRVTLNRSAVTYRYNTPTADNILIELLDAIKQSIWVSQSIDASKATSLESSKIVAVTNLHSGQVIIYSRSKATQGGTWSTWAVSLYDGTLMHPANPFIQLMVILVGEAEIQELTLNLDGEASVMLLKGGMTPGAEYSVTTLNDLAIIVNGDDIPLKWDALTDPVALGTDPPILSMVVTHHNKAWGVDSECPSRVRFSNILDPTKWDAYDFIDFNPDDGDQITSIIRYGQNLIVSKFRAMAMLTGNRSSNYSVSWLDSETGAAGKNGMCIADKYLVYVAQDGIRFTDLSQSIVSTERLIPSWEGINKRRLNQAACVYWKNKCFIALPSEGSLHNDTVWVYDFLRNAWAIIDGWEVAIWKTFNQYGEDVLLAGSSVTGQLYMVDVTTYDDTIPVEFEWRSKDFNFKTPEKYKLFRNVFVDIEGVAETTDLEVDLIVDGVVKGTYTTVIPAGAGVKTTRRILPPLYGAVLGSTFGLQVRGRCGIQGITIEYTVRGNIPGGDL